MSTTQLERIETPAAIVDVERMRANIARAARYCLEHGLDWRPHVKTHKVPALATEQLRAGAVGVTVATMREAEEMATVCDDILLAYPPIGEAKLDRLMSLPDGVRLTVALDSTEALTGLAAAALAAGREVGVLVECDFGMHRVGVPSAEDAAALATEAAALDGVDYRGILFYPGHVRRHASEQAPALRELASTLEGFLHALEAVGCTPAVVSGGSTPTLWRSHEIPGLTEIRPGTNIFNDRTTAVIGVSSWDEIAYSILATVVSTRVPGQAVIDAGAKSLAKEELRGEGAGFGALLSDPGVVVRAVSEEHGILDLSSTDWRPRVGDQVRVVPNHVCLSVHLQERLLGVRGDEVEAEWVVSARDRGPR